MTADMLDLARRAVACPKWRWMPGMADCYGRRLREGDWLDPAVEFPDLTDPATLGCLLALVREAWGQEDMGTFRWGSGRWSAHYAPFDAAKSRVFDADTEAHALVGALEAAP